VPEGRISRAIAAAEAIAVFLACQLFLWQFSQRYRRGWLLILGFILASMLLRRDSLEKLGLSFHHTRGAARWTAIGVVVACVPILLYGALKGRVGVLVPDAMAILQFTGYFGWCVLQQFALQSYMHNRVREALPEWPGVPLLIGVIFGSLHLPNPVLTLATFAGGIASAEVFARYRNIWILGLGQALISTALFVALPDAWHHRLRVGPGYFWWGIERPK